MNTEFMRMRIEAERDVARCSRFSAAATLFKMARGPMLENSEAVPTRKRWPVGLCLYYQAESATPALSRV